MLQLLRMSVFERSRNREGKTLGVVRARRRRRITDYRGEVSSVVLGLFLDLVRWMPLGAPSSTRKSTWWN